MNRRDFSGGLASLATLLASSAHAETSPAQRHSPDDLEPSHDMSHMPDKWYGKEQIALLIYPGFTALDMVGPHYMLTSLMGATVHIVGKTKSPVKSDAGLIITPTATFDECPKDLDIIFAPGGTTGTLEAMRDAETIAFMKDRGARAKYVTSVCTGSLILGAAGLLDGYRATSHWLMRAALSKFGAIPVDERVVVDRNRITGAGVTSGLDFGLSFVGRLRDKEYAQRVQLIAEYAPKPPYNAGSPHTAPRAATKSMEEMFAGFLEKVDKVAGETAAQKGEQGKARANP